VRGGFADTVPVMNRFSRRTFLAGAAASITLPTVLAACGDSNAAPTDTTVKGSGPLPKGKIELIRFNADGYLTTGKQRLPIGLADAKAVVVTGGPSKLTGRVLDGNGKVVGADMLAERRGEGMPRPFWPFAMTLATPGVYQLQVDTNGKDKAVMAFTVVEPSKVPTPKPGDQLRFIETATISKPLGVDPICTRNPDCPFHSVSLKDAQSMGKPIVLLVSTPAHCQFAVCGPVLEFLIDEQKRIGDKIVPIHVEVYKDDGGLVPADAMEQYGLTFEPVLFLADATGKVVERYDVLFDQKELGAALDALVAGK
jgi:hypothetical protein